MTLVVIPTDLHIRTWGEGHGMLNEEKRNNNELSREAHLLGASVIEEPFDICTGEVCSHFGGCAQCAGMMVAREVDAEGQQVGAAKVFLCTHWCHTKACI